MKSGLKCTWSRGISSLLPVLAAVLFSCSREAGGSPDEGAKRQRPASARPPAAGDAGIATEGSRSRPAVVEEGVIQAVNCLTVTARKRGQVTWLVEEGSTVKKRDRVIEMEHEDLIAEIEDQEVTLREAEALVTEKQDGFADQKKELEQELKAAQSALELARFKLEVLHDGPTPAARAEARARLEKAKAALEVAREAHDRARGLRERGVISQDELNQVWIEMERTRLAAKLEEVSWRLLVRGPEPVALAKAKLDIDVAKLNLAVAEERLASQVAALRNGIDEAKLSVARLRDRVRRIQRRINQSILKAPGPGMVVYGMVGHSMKRKIDVGSRVWPGMSLITLPDLSTLKVSTQVGEEIVGSLRQGQQLPVKVVSIDGTTYTGEIIRIDIWGQDRNELLDETGRKAEGLYGTKVYRVDVKILEKDDRLNLGFKARVYFPLPGTDVRPAGAEGVAQ
jgi:multidrug resistance efflux pump